VSKIIDYILQGEHPLELLKLIATLATAYFTVRWSLKKVLQEKKWERKSDAYSRIIESLHHLKRVTFLYLVIEQEQRRLSDEKRRELDERSRKARNELEKFKDMGLFIISEHATDSLNQLWKKLEECSANFENGESMEEILEKQLLAVENCLTEMKLLANKELGN